MSQDESRRIGLIIGREWDWPSAFMDAVNRREAGVTAELVKLGGTFMDEACAYDVIVDRMSHEIPYYRAFLKYAAIHNTFIINNPFTWSADSKFFAVSMANKLGLNSPRTVVLPNKHIEIEVVPDSFRNLTYPMDWQAIIDYVGVPAIFKDNHAGGRRPAHRVSNVDELIQRYDESGTRTKVLQQVIESDVHIHCFVVGQENVLALRYSPADGRYLPDIITGDSAIGQRLSSDALRLARAYQYDVNMVEFVIKDDTVYVINGTNPAPDMDKELMTPEQFGWCVNEIAELAIRRAQEPLPQRAIFTLDEEAR
ncbi:MAG TPA: hypothetical protein VF177_06960 [Anaerolineae bacterium]